MSVLTGVKPVHVWGGDWTENTCTCKLSSLECVPNADARFPEARIGFSTDIMSFSDKISDYFLNMTIDEIKDDEVQNIEEKSKSFYNFCTNCGKENKDNYKFCIECGNSLVTWIIN